MDGAYVNKVEINVNNGGQVYIAEGNAVVAAVQNNCNGAKSIKQKIKSRTQEYADKWNENMFLNDFDEWDENAGVNVKLSDVYLEEHLPHFVWGNNIIVSTNLHTFLSRYIVEKNGNEMLLVFGQPGIGKSTLITWITANFADQIDNILVYRFASDLKTVDWWDDNVSRAILGTLRLSYDDLNGKTLVLDGFDEINIGKDRKEVLDKIYWDLVKKIKNFSLIITCRENYVDKFERVACKYIILKPWDENQIISFCRIFQEKTKNNLSESTKKKLLENKEILGIPLILYMVLALNISVEKGGSIVDVYDKIFALEGGIYDRCIDNKSFADKHRISEIKEQIHQISRDIAIWMFENRPEEAYIPQEEYQKICAIVIQDENSEKEDIQKDFLIGNYFRLVRHCEGTETETLYFVHRSIYEYFVAEAIYSSIEDSLLELSEKSQEEFAGNITQYLGLGLIGHYLGKCLQYKILNLYDKLETARKEIFFQWWETAVSKIINYGMFYYTNKNIKEFKNIIVKEIICFTNIVKLLMLLSDTRKGKFILTNIDRKQFERYIKYYSIEWVNVTKYGALCLENAFLEEVDFIGVRLVGVNLSRSNLRKANLSGSSLSRSHMVNTNMSNAQLVSAYLPESDLSYANLTEANLCNADLVDCYLIDSVLRGAKLIKSDLRGADLTDADLKGADLADADLRGARFVDTKLDDVNLEGATFDSGQVMYLEKKYDMKKTKVYLGETEELISYEEYCNRKQ